MPEQTTPAPRPERVTLTGEDLYAQHGWSGCDGSHWRNLSPATREGWEFAAAREQALREEIASQIEGSADTEVLPSVAIGHRNGLRHAARIARGETR